VAYGIGVALVAALPLSYGARYVVLFATTPSATALEAGHGYFTGTANRALADAVVARDAARVVSLAPSANVNAVGWNRMTFMRLALEDGRADPDVVAALLRAGADPDQDNQLLFGFITESDADYGVMIKEKNERLLRAVINAGVDLNQWNREGYPRFFSALKWPQGLALMLEHGANTQAEDKNGYTAIMWAVMLRYWPSIEVLLAHGARLDHVAPDGKSLRSIVSEERGRLNGEIPPQLAALAARLR
jgi:ankyrin repeat protein